MNILDSDENDKKRYILQKFDENIKYKKNVKNLYYRLMSNGAGLKYLLFNRWKDMPDVKVSLVDNAANELERKLAKLCTNSVNNGLNALNNEYIDGKSKMSANARALVDSQ